MSFDGDQGPPLCSPHRSQFCRPPHGNAVQVRSRFQGLLPFLVVFAMVAAFAANQGRPTTVESARIAAAQESVVDLADPVNPLFVVLLRRWASVNDHLVWVRFLGVVTGLVALAIAHTVMRGLGGAHAAPAAMTLLATSPVFVSAAATVSSTPLVLAAAMSCFAAFLEFSRTGRKSWLAIWLFTALLCLSTHAVLLLVILVQNASLLFYGRRLQHRQRFWWGAQLPVGGVFLLLHHDRLAALGIAGWSPSLSGLPSLVSMPGFAVVLLLVLCLSGTWSRRDWRRDPRHGLLLLSAISPLVTWLFFPRELLILLALPALLVLASMGIRLYPQWMRQLLWSGLVMVYGADYWRMFGSG